MLRTLTCVTSSWPTGAGVWARVRAGDAEAFADVYRAQADPIFGFCVRRTGDWSTAQDCTSIVFLEAWRLRGQLRADESINAWLFGIANNVVRNSVRARRRHQAMLDSLPTIQPDPCFEADLVARLDSERAVAGAASAMRELPRSDRELLALAAWSDLTTDEIAQALDIRPGTVKSRLSRARAKARRAINDDPSAGVWQSLIPTGQE